MPDSIVPYTTVIGPRNKRSLVLKNKGWRLIYSPGTNRSIKDLEGWKYCLDNGAWTAYTSGKPWDETKFVRLVDKLGNKADFIVAPDIVGGGLKSLKLSESWLPRLPGLRLIAVQDGIKPLDIEGMLGSEVGLFLGGTTKWKLKTMYTWGELAKKKVLVSCC